MIGRFPKGEEEPCTRLARAAAREANRGATIEPRRDARPAAEGRQDDAPRRRDRAYLRLFALSRRAPPASRGGARRRRPRGSGGARTSGARRADRLAAFFDEDPLAAAPGLGACTRPRARLLLNDALAAQGGALTPKKRRGSRTARVRTSRRRSAVRPGDPRDGLGGVSRRVSTAPERRREGALDEFLIARR